MLMICSLGKLASASHQLQSWGEINSSAHTAFVHRRQEGVLEGKVRPIIIITTNLSLYPSITSHHHQQHTLGPRSVVKYRPQKVKAGPATL